MTPRILITSIVLAAALGICYGTPKIKHQSPEILSKLAVPSEFRYWTSEEMSDKLNLQDDRFNFISRVFARLYRNDLDESLLFLILDAGNFHHPKVCFTSSGYTVDILGERTLTLKDGKPLNVQMVYADKDGKGYLVVYWMVVDRQKVNWTEQKMLQLIYSAFNRKKVGLMGRLDIPTRRTSLDNAESLAASFIRDVSSTVPAEWAPYLFGGPAVQAAGATS